MDCVFCGIVKKEVPAKIVAENEKALAFMDVNPASDGHTVVISKKHYRCFSETPVDVLQAMVELCHTVANKIANSKLKPWGFNYLCNEGKIAQQVVMHVHMQVIPKYGKDEGWKSTRCKNIFVNDVQQVYQTIMKAKD